MIDDRRLLQDYVHQDSQSAFAKLVNRHLKLVYATCLREVGNADLAEDMTQIVFLIFAQKAPKLPPNVLVTGWLFNTARFVGRNARRQSQRQKSKEVPLIQEMTNNTLGSAPWHSIEPILNDALCSLGAKDREIVLMRFFDELSFAEIGMRFGTSEDGARMRLTRALEKMRRSIFAKSGIALSGTILLSVLTEKSAPALPDTCVTSIAEITSNLSAGNLLMHLVDKPIYPQVQGILHAMKITRLKRTISVGIAGTLLAVLPFIVLAQPPTSQSSNKIILVNSKVFGVPQADWKQIKVQAHGNDTKIATTIRTKKYNLLQNPRVSTLDGLSASISIGSYREKITSKINKNDTITIDTDISYSHTVSTHANRTVHSGQAFVLSDTPTDINALVNVTIITPTIMPPQTSTVP